MGNRVRRALRTDALRGWVKRTAGQIPPVSSQDTHRTGKGLQLGR